MRHRVLLTPPTFNHVSFPLYSLPVELLDTLRREISSVSLVPIPISYPSRVYLYYRSFRSDWHRYNVKTRLNGGQPVSELEFSKLVDALEDSISGSASEDSDADDSDDAVDALVSKALRKPRSRSPSQGPASAPQTALAWFHSPPATQLGVYKALFNSGVHQSDYLAELKRMQTGGRTWAMFMVAGGHFAGAIPDTEVLNHKTFHRYTTRRKQGGSQGLNDNAKGAAKSAGAQLRRYGEQLCEINQCCERIWIRATGTNRKIFIDYEGCVIEKGDGRLRTFPFPTRRPTQSELSRCLMELTRAKTSHLTEDALRAQDEAYLASLPKPKPMPIAAVPAPEKPKPVKLSKEEEILRRLEPLKSFWDREGDNLGGVDTLIPDWAGEKRATLLQVAAHAATKIRDNDSDDASDSPRPPKGSLRDIFRRCAGAHPDWWDWFGARVRWKRNGRRRRKLGGREREGKAKPSPPEPEPKPTAPEQKVRDPTGPRKLGGVSGATEGIAGLTPEMRARVERERRARAAEARMNGILK
ncbi:hypothetical protein B0H13DRAFT_1991605 [Mycena leptocephala]|nr:hypothetical protein B0H13DRAFT_1991605 [Mycena leptocephala]